MSAASDLIERMEQETGSRIDSNNGDNLAIAGLLGALARIMGKSSHDERDDVAAGVVIRHQMTPEYKLEQESERMMAAMLAVGMSPDDINDLLG